MKTIVLILVGLSGFIFAESPVHGNLPNGLSASDWFSIREAYEAGRHAVHRKENGTLAARNPSQQWLTEFDGKGFLTTPDQGGWTWGLELIGYGERTLVSASTSVTHEGGHIRCQRDENLTEWFINDTCGLEQGWTIQRRPERPEASSTLQLQLSLRGDLHAQISIDGSSVSFQTKTGTTALTYSGLKAWDATGNNLAIRFEQADPKHFSIAVDDKNACYPITIDPIAQQAYLKASNTGSYDGFGISVAISGDTVVVGAYGEESSSTGVNTTPDESSSSSGAAYVFVRSGTTWNQQAYLKASNTGSNDNFGVSVAVSGNTVVVGAPGESSSTTGIDRTPNEGASDSGAAYVFVRSGATWIQQAYIKASNTGVDDVFGCSVAVSGDTVVVGARGERSSTTGINSTPNEGASYSGAAYVFVRSGTTWSEQAYLKASNTGSNDTFGASVAVSGNTVVVGAGGESSSTTGINSTPNEGASYSGAAYVFVRSGATWIQQAYIKASNTGVDDVFGCSVAVSGDTVVVGARGERSSTTGINSTPNEGARYSGAAYVFVRSGTTWSQQAYLKASNSTADHKFGNSVGVSGNTVVVGSQGEDSSTTGVNSNPNNVGQFYDGGAAYVFVRSGTTWIQQAYLKASNTGVYDEFGCSVAVSGDTVVIGAYHESSSTAGVNTTPNEGAKFSGATYVFVGLGPIPAPEIAIQQAGTVLASSGTMALGSSAVGSISERIFTLLNIGDADLFLIGAPKVAVTGSSDFTVIAQPTSPVTGPSGSTTFTVRFTPSSIGSKIANLSIPNNDANENPFVINLIGDGVTAASIFNGVASGSGLTGSDAEPDANPFNDGVNNLLKYAFNMNLGAADSHGMALGGNSGLPAIMLVGSGPATMIRVEYLRRIGSGLVYAPKRSINLGSGTFVPMIGTPVITPVSDAWERVVVQDPADPATLPTLFAIIEVLIP